MNSLSKDLDILSNRDEEVESTTQVLTVCTGKAVNVVFHYDSCHCCLVKSLQEQVAISLLP